MRIVWLCHYFAPEIGAPQARLLEMSRVFVEDGHDVAAVTCFPNHPTGELRPEDRGVRHRRDEMDGIQVFRCRSYITANRGFVKKLLGHLSFMLSGYFGLSRAAGEARPDVVIVSSPTFFSVITAWFWCAWRGIPYVFEVRDLWPAVFVELGVLRNRFLIGCLERLEMFLYRRAARVVTVTTTFAETIGGRGIAREKLAVVTNGVDETRFMPAAGPVERRPELAGRFVVLYLGAHGISHALASVLDAAALLADMPEVLFVFVGEGAEKEGLVARASELGLENVLFHAGVPKDDVLGWYQQADVGLVPLRAVEIFKTFIPSKMFELMAAGLPIVGSVEGEARALLERSGGARVVDPEDAEGIAREVRVLHADPALRERLARAGHAFAIENYTRRALAREYLQVLGGIGGAP